MKAEKLIVARKPVDISILEITLLSIDEYEQCCDNIPILDNWWWLRSPGLNAGCAASILNEGSLNRYGTRVDRRFAAIRPLAVIRADRKLRAGGKVKMAGHTWTMISNDRMLCDEDVGHTCFRRNYKASNACDYEASDIRKWLDDWTKENGITVDGEAKQR